MQAAVRELMVMAGIKDIRRAVHSLGHTLGAELRKRGADIRDIQDVLRHAGIGTTPDLNADGPSGAVEEAPQAVCRPSLGETDVKGPN